MSEDKNRPATVGDLEAKRDELKEFMRGLQSEVLRGFQAFSTPQTLRIRKVEADQSNLDASISGRVEVLEERLHQIEHRLGTDPPELRK